MKEIKKIELLKNKIENLAKKINVPQYLLPKFEHDSNGDFIDVSRDGMLFYISEERGIENKRIATFDENKILYELFSDITHYLASKYAAKNRSLTVDQRRILFSRQIELLSVLFPEWGELKRKEQDKILAVAPFDDNSRLRASFSNELKKDGKSSAEAWKVACEKYPLPDQ